jgi:hypothetical protein
MDALTNNAHVGELRLQQAVQGLLRGLLWFRGRCCRGSGLRARLDQSDPRVVVANTRARNRLGGVWFAPVL